LYAYDRADFLALGDKGKGGILFRYVDQGQNANKVKYIQFVRLTVEVHEWLDRYDKARNCYDTEYIGGSYIRGRFPHNPEHIPSMEASTPRNPLYYFDVLKGAKEPYYAGMGGVDLPRRTAWMWDRPGFNEEVANDFGIPYLKSSRNPGGIIPRGPWPAGNAKYIVRQSFDTYVIAAGKAVALVQWEQTSVASVFGRSIGGVNKPQFNVDRLPAKIIYVGKPGGGTNPEPDLVGALKRRFGEDQGFVIP
jgi:hypothetical protein